MIELAGRRVGDVVAELERELALRFPDSGIEYVSAPAPQRCGDRGRTLLSDDDIMPEGYRWIACYAVTGPSEGHYVHCEALYAPGHRAESRNDQWNTFVFCLVKTFGGRVEAREIAAACGELLGA